MIRPNIRYRRLTLAAATLGLSSFAAAAQVTANWAAVDANWQNAANWGGAVPNNGANTYIAVFPGSNTSATTVDLGGAVTVDQLTLTHGAALTLGDSADDTFTLTGGTTGVGVSVPAYNTTTLARTIGASVKLTPATGTVIQFDTNATTSTSGDAPVSLNLTGIVSGAAGLLKLGNGGLQLSGVNTYTGVTTVQRNWIYVASNAPAGAAGALGNATSAIELGNASTATADTGLVTNGAVTIGRDINVNVTGTGTTFLGSGTAQTSASSAYAGTITLNRGIQIVSSTTNGNLVDFQGKFTGVGGILKRSAGTAQFSSATSDYTGTTTLRGGFLLLNADAPKGAPGALGNATSVVAIGDSGSTSNFGLFTNGAVVVGRDIAVSALPAASVIGSLGGAATQTNASSTFSGTIALGRDTRLQSYTVPGQAVAFTGVISSSTAGRGIVTTGPGTVRLTGANTYNGATFVGSDGLNGTLLIDGPQTGGGSYSVLAGSTLGGIGSISTGTAAAGLTVAAGGIINPGNTAAVGTFALTGDANLNGTDHVDLTAAVADRLVVVGVLTIDPSSTLAFTTLSPLTAQSYILADYTTLNGTWSPANISGLPSGWQIDYRFNGNNQIAIAVPEPTAGLILLGLPALLRRRSRR